MASHLEPLWENTIKSEGNFSSSVINANSLSSTNGNNMAPLGHLDESVLGFLEESINSSILNSSANATNGTGSFEPTQEDICVMCKYYLQPWLKTLRVGFGSCIVLANIATFIMLLRARTLQLALRYFLLNVAVVDCGYGAGFLYHSAIVDFPQFVMMNFECKLRYGGLCMVSMVALFTLMAMCVERVIALKFAFSYHLIITRTNLLIGIAIFWAVPAAIVTPTYILMDSSVGECNFVRFISAESFVVFSVTYFMLMMVAVFCQLVLLFIAKAHIRKILPTIVGDQKKKASFKMNLKATSTTLSLAVPFVICAAPKVLTYMFLAFNPRERIKLESLTLLAVTVYLNVSNSFINPIVYCYRLPELRSQIMAIFGRRATSPFGSSAEPIKPSNESESEGNDTGNEKCGTSGSKITEELSDEKRVTVSSDHSKPSGSGCKSSRAQPQERAISDGKIDNLWRFLKSQKQGIRKMDNPGGSGLATEVICNRNSSPPSRTQKERGEQNQISQRSCKSDGPDKISLVSTKRGDKDDANRDLAPYQNMATDEPVKYAWLMDSSPSVTKPRHQGSDIDNANWITDFKPKTSAGEFVKNQIPKDASITIYDHKNLINVVEAVDTDHKAPQKHHDLKFIKNHERDETLSKISTIVTCKNILKTWAESKQKCCDKKSGFKIAQQKGQLSLGGSLPVVADDDLPINPSTQYGASRPFAEEIIGDSDIPRAESPGVKFPDQVYNTERAEVVGDTGMPRHSENSDTDSGFVKYAREESEISPYVMRAPLVITSHLGPSSIEESLWIRCKGN